MAATHIAVVTHEVEGMLVHFPPDTTPIPAGPIEFEVRGHGQIVLAPSKANSGDSSKQAAWLRFLDHVENTPRDPDFMLDRPMNRLPVEHSLFPDE